MALEGYELNCPRVALGFFLCRELIDFLRVVISIFFNFLKIIFDISTSKLSKNIFFLIEKLKKLKFIQKQFPNALPNTLVISQQNHSSINFFK